VRNPQGYGVVTSPEFPYQVEHDTFTCFHCQRVEIVAPFKNPEDIGGFCKVCSHLICARCASMGMCRPWLEQLERIEAKNRFLRSAGLGE